MNDTIAVTGAAGRIGTTVLPLLRRPGRRFVLIDSVPVDARRPEDDVRRLDVHDLPGLVDALEGASTLVHLAGIPHETEWAELLSVNIDGSAGTRPSPRKRRSTATRRGKTGTDPAVNPSMPASPVGGHGGALLAGGRQCRTSCGTPVTPG